MAKRKIIQIACYGMAAYSGDDRMSYDNLFALADDGTIWRMENPSCEQIEHLEWQLLPPLPSNH
jgi:hypothetical protein